MAGLLLKGRLPKPALCLILSCVPAFAQDDRFERARELITIDLLRKHVEVLASDEFEGRNTGCPGEEKAVRYIAGVLEQAGIQPAAGGWFQRFPVGRREGWNCMGRLEGSDPELRKEYVAISAHHDHLGVAGQMGHARDASTDSDDPIWNGADDNASGVAVVLAVARAFGEGGLRPRRSILFLTFGGEEIGLLGSAYYVNHPAAPIDRHVFLLNLDIVGRDGGKPAEIHGTGCVEGDVLRRAAERAVSKADLRARIFAGDLLKGTSDFTTFCSRQVPFLTVFVKNSEDYHRPTDEAGRLNYPNMAKVARASLHLLLEIADGGKRPVFSRRAAAGLFTGDADWDRSLGIFGKSLDEQECAGLGLEGGRGGMRVEDILRGSPAEAAGLREGDVILDVAGCELTRSETRARLREILRKKVQPGREVPLSISREGKIVKLKATWPE